MAYYLEIAGSDTHVAVDTAIVVPPVGTDGVLLSLDIQFNDLGTHQAILSSGTSNFIDIKNNGSSMELRSTSAVVVFTLSPPLVANQRYLLTVERTDRSLVVKNNGDVISNTGTQAVGRTFSVTRISGLSAGFRPGNFRLYALTFPLNNNDYNSSTSNGTGLTLIDTEGGNDGTLVNFPTDNSQWLWEEDTPLNTGESRVGSGWAPSIRDYSLLNDWKNAKKTEPTYQTALCRGYLGNPFFDIVAADFPAGALISGVVKYTGNNHDQLAHYARKFVINSTSQVIAEHLKITHSTGLQPTVGVQNTGGSIIRNSYVLNTGQAGANSGSAVLSGNGTLQNCVVHGTQPVNNLVLRPSNQAQVLNCIAIGGYTGLSMPWPDVVVDSTFIVNASNACIIGNVPTTNTATEDTTGEFTGYTTSAFVDFANGDYRIRVGSPLHKLGIGAFFQEDLLPELDYQEYYELSKPITAGLSLTTATEVIILPSEDVSIEFTFTLNQVPAFSEYYYLFGADSWDQNHNLRKINNTDYSIRLRGILDATFSTPVILLGQNEVNKIIVSRSAGELEVWINNHKVSAANISAQADTNFQLKHFFRYNTNTYTNAVTLGYFKIRRDDILTNYWVNAQSPTASEWVDVIGNNDASFSGSWPINYSHWKYISTSSNLVGESRVGTGWAPSIRDFNSLENWRDGITNTQKNYALCRGSILTRHISFGNSNTFPLGLEIIGDVKYKGNNLAELAHTNNFGMDIGGSPIRVHHLYLYTDNRYYVPAWIRYTTPSASDILSFNHCYIKHTNVDKLGQVTSGNGSSENDGWFNCIIDCDGRAYGYSVGYSQKVSLINNTYINYTTTGFNSPSFGNPSGRFYENNFCPENTGTDYNVQGFGSFINNASADTTGNITGYGKEQFVDFANGDYRIKASSPLHALGIGSFFEEAGTPTSSYYYSDVSNIQLNSVTSIDYIIDPANDPTAPNYVLFLNGADEYVQLNSPINITTPEFEIEFIGNGRAYDESVVYIFGNLGDANNRLWIGGVNYNELSLSNAAGQTINFTNMNFFVADENRLVISRDINNIVSVSINGVPHNQTFVLSGDITPSILGNSGGALPSGIARADEIEIDKLKVTVGGVVINHYEPTVTEGVGIILKDTESGNDGTIINFKSNLHHWKYYDGIVIDEQTEVRIGNGWASKVYVSSTTLGGFLDTYKSLTFTDEITCYAVGDCSYNEFFDKTGETLNFTNADFEQGLYVKGMIPFNGKNYDRLARLNNQITSNSQLFIDDFYIYSEQVGTSTLVADDNTYLYRCYVEHTGGASELGIVQMKNYSDLTNCVVRSLTPSPLGVSALETSFIGNTVVLGCDVNIKLSAPSGSYEYLFATQSTLSDFDDSGIYVFEYASGDNTGQYTGYTTAEFVDFANKDYRIKYSSDLHPLGIGAFFQEFVEGGISYFYGDSSVLTLNSEQSLYSKIANSYVSTFSIVGNGNGSHITVPNNQVSTISIDFNNELYASIHQGGTSEVGVDFIPNTSAVSQIIESSNVQVDDVQSLMVEISNSNLSNIDILFYANVSTHHNINNISELVIDDISNTNAVMTNNSLSNMHISNIDNTYIATNIFDYGDININSIDRHSVFSNISKISEFNFETVSKFNFRMNFFQDITMDIQTIDAHSGYANFNDVSQINIVSIDNVKINVGFSGVSVFDVSVLPNTYMSATVDNKSTFDISDVESFIAKFEIQDKSVFDIADISNAYISMTVDKSSSFDVSNIEAILAKFEVHDKSNFDVSDIASVLSEFQIQDRSTFDITDLSSNLIEHNIVDASTLFVDDVSAITLHASNHDKSTFNIWIDGDVFNSVSISDVFSISNFNLIMGEEYHIENNTNVVSSFNVHGLVNFHTEVNHADMSGISIITGDSYNINVTNNNVVDINVENITNTHMEMNQHEESLIEVDYLTASNVEFNEKTTSSINIDDVQSQYVVIRTSPVSELTVDLVPIYSVEFNAYTNSGFNLSYTGNPFIAAIIMDRSIIDLTIIDEIEYIIASPEFKYFDKSTLRIDGVDASTIFFNTSTVANNLVDFVPEFNTVTTIANGSMIDLVMSGNPILAIEYVSTSELTIDMVQSSEFVSLISNGSALDITTIQGQNFLVAVKDGSYNDLTIVESTNVAVAENTTSALNVSFSNQIQYASLYNDVSKFDVAFISEFFIVIDFDVYEYSERSISYIDVVPNYFVSHAEHSDSVFDIGTERGYNIEITDDTVGDIVVSIKTELDVRLFNNITIYIKPTDIGTPVVDTGKSWLDDSVFRTDMKTRTIITGKSMLDDLVISTAINRTTTIPLELSTRA
ncbi:hypothetical protein [Alishewanella phage vB_AspM_Slickus01]|nr:hypothetical protein [Alishewanella phage vB_AspM_Slickus01]